jgi:hypothetical protein
MAEGSSMTVLGWIFLVVIFLFVMAVGFAERRQ